MNRGTSGERRDSSLDESSPRKKEGSRFYLISLAGENFLLSSLDVSRVFSSLPFLFSLSNERQKRDPQKDVSCEEGERRVVGVEMNWQLLIKIVSCSLPRPRSRGCSPFSGKSAEKTVPPYEPNETGGGRRVGVSSRDAVSILFVHANYSSWVTLLEIEGNRALPFSSAREERERPADLFLLLPWGFPNVGPDYPPTPLRCTGEEDLSSRNNASSTLRGRF